MLIVEKNSQFSVIYAQNGIRGHNALGRKALGKQSLRDGKPSGLNALDVIRFFRS